MLNLIFLNFMFAGGDRDSAKSIKAEKRIDAFKDEVDEKKEKEKEERTLLKGLSKLKGANGELSIGALIIPEFDWVDQDFTKNGERDGGRPNLNIGDSKLWFNAKIKNDKGLQAGYTIRLSPQTNKDKVFDRNYIWLKHDSFGTLEMGNVKGPHDSMCKLAQALIPTGWLDGALDPNFYSTSGVYNAIDPIGHTGTATKISWYSPEVHGFQVAFSYTPSTVHQGQNKRSDKHPLGIKGNVAKGNPSAWFSDKEEEVPFGTNHVQFAALYKKESGNWKFWLSGAFMLDRSQIHIDKDKIIANLDETVEINKTRSYMISTLVGYKDVALAIEYMDGLKSRLPIDANTFISGAPNAKLQAGKNALTVGDAHTGNAGRAVNTVFKWQIDDKNCAALGFHYSWRNVTRNAKASRTVYTAAYTRKLMEGISWFAEASVINSKLKESNGSNIVGEINAIKAGSGVPNNRGFLFVTGFAIYI